VRLERRIRQKKRKGPRKSIILNLRNLPIESPEQKDPTILGADHGKRDANTPRKGIKENFFGRKGGLFAFNGE